MEVWLRKELRAVDEDLIKPVIAFFWSFCDW